MISIVIDWLVMTIDDWFWSYLMDDHDGIDYDHSSPLYQTYIATVI